MTCVVCGGLATVYWPVKLRPYCRPCVDEARAFLKRTANRYPMFGSVRFTPEPTHIALGVNV